MKSYSNFEELVKDVEAFQNNPHNDALCRKIVKKIDNSPRELKQRLVIFLEEYLLDTDIDLVLHRVSLASPNHIVMVNKNDVWFFT